MSSTWRNYPELPADLTVIEGMVAHGFFFATAAGPCLTALSPVTGETEGRTNLSDCNIHPQNIYASCFGALQSI
ncbi:hypothetical protein DSM19430T_23430 [Desulfovibrio psychrotolerans]|uniref:Uncharacterized protein n=1 Tax=Desulfovibrio psychrotolerans TaxID=415242 RepID=A0A7J0BVB7_9BACT|nr:hypothetical protein DSM19430T_23430 [Desulfovibrio psychrotolerans]